MLTSGLFGTQKALRALQSCLALQTRMNSGTGLKRTFSFEDWLVCENVAKDLCKGLLRFREEDARSLSLRAHGVSENPRICQSSQEISL